MQCLLAVFLGTILATIGNVPYPRLNLAPTEGPPEDFTKTGLSIFDLQVNTAGQVVDDSLLVGRPPFIERARRSFTRWQFEERSGADIHVNATVIFQPRLGVPGQPNELSVPVPSVEKENIRSPFPIHIVMPAFPLNGMFGGTVVIQAGLEVDGAVRYVQVLSGPPSLMESAVASIQKWRFYVPQKSGLVAPSAVVVVYFQSPEFGTSTRDNPPETSTAEATLIRGTAPGVPVGAQGDLTTGPNGLVFHHGDSHYPIPYSLITNVGYIALPGSEDHLFTITYSGVDAEQIISFRVTGDAGLSAASVVSSQSRRPIDFSRPTTPIS
jgi:hypothetical protein